MPLLNQKKRKRIGRRSKHEEKEKEIKGIQEKEEIQASRMDVREGVRRLP